MQSTTTLLPPAKRQRNVANKLKIQTGKEESHKRSGKEDAG